VVIRATFTPRSAAPTSPAHLDEAHLQGVIGHQRLALALFASPDNPTPNRVDPALLERLARPLDAVFVADQAYAHLLLERCLRALRNQPKPVSSQPTGDASRNSRHETGRP
jgi:histidinol-phosphate/aromatic aminotransferase/cobyric acid decarboxylase-like protein